MRGRTLTLLFAFTLSASAVPFGHRHGAAHNVPRDPPQPDYYYAAGNRGADRGPAGPGAQGPGAAPSAPSAAAQPTYAPAAPQPTYAPAAPQSAAPNYSPSPSPDYSPSPAPATPSPGASAAPSTPSSYPGGSTGGSGGDFQIQISNNCGSEMQFGIYQVDSSFNMNQISNPVSIPSGGSGSLNAPFDGVGMRLSGTAGSGTANQWSPQALLEFGHSSYDGVDGTAYDASVMGGSDGIAVYPSNPACPSKVCKPGDCSAGQGWTNPDQVNEGSPADTVCYHGKTNFHVVWCP